MSAAHAFLKNNNRFQIDASIHDKLLIAAAYDGHVKCVKE
jgi:cephalosporin hydroxylase